MGGEMKNTWFLWFLGVGVVITILIALNFEGGRKTVPLNEIFPDESQTQSIEYEFADAENDLTTLVEKSEGKKAPSPASGSDPKAVSPQVPAPVAVPQASGTDAPAAAPLSGKAFTVQIASFKDEDRAQKALAQAKDKGYAEAFIDSKGRSDGGFNYQICVGRFHAMAEAKNFLSKLQQDYKDGFIRNIQGH
jgi:cell division septation protein DedD